MFFNILFSAIKAFSPKLTFFFADQKTTDAAITALLPQYYDKVALEELFPQLVFYNHGDKKPLPKGMGKTANWYRIRKPAAVTSNMTELTVPTQSSMSADRVSATVIQRGSYLQFDELVDLTGINPLIEDAVRHQSRQAARSVDTYIQQNVTFVVANASSRSALNKGDASPNTGAAAKIWSGGATENGFHVYHNKTKLAESATVQSIAKTALTVKSILHAVKVLRANDAFPMAGGDYVGIIHPEAEYQIMTQQGFKGWQQYTTPDKMFNGEIGRIGGVRFVRSSDAPSFTLSGDTLSTGSATMYGTLVVGRGAYGVTEISGSGQNRGFRVYIKRSGDQTTSDPVSQKITVGWKMTMATRVLNKSAGVTIISTEKV